MPKIIKLSQILFSKIQVFWHWSSRSTSFSFVPLLAFCPCLTIGLSFFFGSPLYAINIGNLRSVGEIVSAANGRAVVNAVDRPGEHCDPSFEKIAKFDQRTNYYACQKKLEGKGYTPYRAVVAIGTGDQAGGVGTLVGNSCRLVVTAGHNIRNRKGPYWVEYMPADNSGFGVEIPFDIKQAVIGQQIDDPLTKADHAENFQKDWAIIVLDTPVAGGKCEYAEMPTEKQNRDLSAADLVGLQNQAKSISPVALNFDRMDQSLTVVEKGGCPGTVSPGGPFVPTTAERLRKSRVALSKYAVCSKANLENMDSGMGFFQREGGGRPILRAIAIGSDIKSDDVTKEDVCNWALALPLEFTYAFNRKAQEFTSPVRVTEGPVGRKDRL